MSIEYMEVLPAAAAAAGGGVMPQTFKIRKLYIHSYSHGVWNNSTA